MSDININALHSDETEIYHFPLEPKAGDIVTIRFRTAKDDVDEIVLVSGEKDIYLEKETSTISSTSSLAVRNLMVTISPAFGSNGKW